MSDTHTITITMYVPLSDVTISGPAAGIANTAYTFTATVSPPTATTPITYTWSPAPDSGQGTSSASYTWATEGVKTITVTAANAGGAVSDTHVITITGLTVRVITYTYDSLNRLTKAGYSTGERFEYAYDQVGNRLRYTQTITGTTVITYVYDAANRLTSVNGVEYSWDNNGNLINDGTRVYTYTQSNRLVAISGPGLEWSAAYNGDGARLRQTVNGTTTTYVQDLAAPLPVVLQAQDATRNTQYVFGTSTRPLAQHDAEWVYLLPDGLGSVRQETSATGNVLATRAFDPYGMPLEGDGGAPYGYTGEEYDGSTGLVFLRARYYDPATGRFTQQDPSGLERNLYAYVASNPVNRIDSSGLFSLRAIAKSYGYSNPDDKEGFLDYFATAIGSWPGSWPRWGWLALLLSAREGDAVSAGAPVSAPPYLDAHNAVPIGCNGQGSTIRVGAYSLKEYHFQALEHGELGYALQTITWRNIRPTHYMLNSENNQFLDYDRPRDLPDFRVASLDVAPVSVALLMPPGGISGIIGKYVTGGGTLVIDRYGRLYGGFFFGFQMSMLGYVSAGEGYIDRYWPPDIRWKQSRMPNEDEIKETITGLCINAQGQDFIGLGGSVCQNGASSSFVFFTPGAGWAVYGSYMWDLEHPLQDWAWDHVDKIPGYTRQDIENMLENEIPQCSKCDG